MTDPEVTTRVVVQEWYAECWMQRVLADDLPAAKAAIARRLEEFPERVYRAVEEQTTVTRRVVVAANEPGKARPKRRKEKGVCQHCSQPVVEADGALILDDAGASKGDGDICLKSPDDKHVISPKSRKKDEDADTSDAAGSADTAGEDEASDG